MKYDLKTPCKDCPFRSDKPFPLRADRVNEIWDAVSKGQTFACHNTVDYGDDDDGVVKEESQMCAGVMILMLKSKVRNLTTVMAHNRYNMKAKVYATIDAMVKGCADRNGR